MRAKPEPTAPKKALCRTSLSVPAPAPRQSPPVADVRNLLPISQHVVEASF
jgi:hypothetical protein